MSYIACYHCETILSKIATLQKQMLEFSFTCFLLGLTGCPDSLPLFFSDSEIRNRSETTCRHDRLLRVFKLEKDLIFFEISSYLILKRTFFKTPPGDPEDRLSIRRGLAKESVASHYQEVTISIPLGHERWEAAFLATMKGLDEAVSNT